MEIQKYNGSNQNISKQLHESSSELSISNESDNRFIMEQKKEINRILRQTSVEQDFSQNNKIAKKIQRAVRIKLTLDRVSQNEIQKKMMEIQDTEQQESSNKSSKLKTSIMNSFKGQKLGKQ